MWGYSIRVVIVPSFLAFTFLGPLIYLHSLTDSDISWFLATWTVAGTAPLSIVQGQFYTAAWGGTLAVAGLALSMTVNALVTGLIVFRIFQVFKEVKIGTVDEQILGVTGGSALQHVIFILIESGMALLSIQLVRFVVTIVFIVAADTTAYATFSLIFGIHEMLNVIIRSVIGLLFY